jgi:site-specific DNA recombinase
MNKPAAIYARVSSDRQKENHTIASQTAALIEYAQTHEYSVPQEWIFQDEGYSGAILARPGLEALRDLAAEGQIAAALIYSPDRLSRKYAYQVLLSEELSRCGVELIFLKAPAGATPEDQLLVQFQGMIAEYERAQIAERCRRGKRHMAQRGGVNVLSGAPYGYRYVRKSDTSAAFYEVIETEAKVVRMVFEIYTQQGLSINAIARLLNERHVATRTGKGRWERSTVWGMLRNPAYRGIACYGKTELRPRQRITRPLRQRKGLPSRDSAGHERPRTEWIEVPVPALVSEEMFALAQEQLEKNKRHSPRRTVEPTLLQGMLVCEQCGYALYRTSTHTSKRRLNYYRCLGSDGYRRLRGAVCTNRPIRQDYLDQFVWSEIIRLLDDPDLVQAEIDRRQATARDADPLRRRQEELRREQLRIEKNSERLLTAYQEGLVTLPQLRQRMPVLQKQAQAVGSELQSLEMAAVDEARYLQLAESLGGFRSKLRVRADTLDVAVRQQILRLIVKEVLVGADTITLRHSIPTPQSGPGSNGSSAPPAGVTGSKPSPGYLLRSGSHFSATGQPVSALVRCAVPRAARSGALGRRQVGAVCRRYGDAGAEVDGGTDCLRGVEAGGQVRTGD